MRIWSPVSISLLKTASTSLEYFIFFDDLNFKVLKPKLNLDVDDGMVGETCSLVCSLVLHALVSKNKKK